MWCQAGAGDQAGQLPAHSDTHGAAAQSHSLFIFLSPYSRHILAFPPLPLPAFSTPSFTFSPSPSPSPFHPSLEADFLLSHPFFSLRAPRITLGSQSS